MTAGFNISGGVYEGGLTVPLTSDVVAALEEIAVRLDLVGGRDEDTRFEAVFSGGRLRLVYLHRRFDRHQLRRRYAPGTRTPS